MRISEMSVRYVAEGFEAVGRLSDVSRSGLYVLSSDLPRPGAIIALQFESPVGKLVDVRGQVRWNAVNEAGPEQPAGFGVRLHEPPRAFRDFVAWVVAEADEAEKDGNGEL